MINKITRTILNLLIAENEICDKDINIYYFGIECILLKLTHYISYILIGVVTKSIFALLISACVFIPLRSNAGGYHAETKVRCYIFSCSMIFFLCMFNRIFINDDLYIIIFLISNLIIYLFSPVESINNELTKYERMLHKKKANIILLFFDIVIGIMIYKKIYMGKYLINGIALVAFLVLLGEYENRYLKISKDRNTV